MSKVSQERDTKTFVRKSSFFFYLSAYTKLEGMLNVYGNTASRFAGFGETELQTLRVTAFRCYFPA
jgi:hypothetical protein